MGAVSNEPAEISNILSRLDEGIITPDEAVKLARQVESNRQENYH
jgi:hypothetical protein